MGLVTRYSISRLDQKDLLAAVVMRSRSSPPSFVQEKQREERWYENRPVE